MSDFLFAHPSLLSGFGRALDLGGSFDSYNESPSPNAADVRAVRNDWTAVGQDLVRAMKETEDDLENGE